MGFDGFLSQASAKKKTKRLKGFNFHTFIGRFQLSDIMAVKGLSLQSAQDFANTDVISYSRRTDYMYSLVKFWADPVPNKPYGFCGR